MPLSTNRAGTNRQNQFNRLFFSTRKNSLTHSERERHITYAAHTFSNEDIQDAELNFSVCFFFHFIMNTSISNWSSNIDCFMFVCHRIETGCTGWLRIIVTVECSMGLYLCVCLAVSNKQFYLLAPSLRTAFRYIGWNKIMLSVYLIEIDGGNGGDTQAHKLYCSRSFIFISFYFSSIDTYFMYSLCMNENTILTFSERSNEIILHA